MSLPACLAIEQQHCVALPDRACARPMYIHCSQSTFTPNTELKHKHTHTHAGSCMQVHQKRAALGLFNDRICALSVKRRASTTRTSHCRQIRWRRRQQQQSGQSDRQRGFVRQQHVHRQFGRWSVVEAHTIANSAMKWRTLQQRQRRRRRMSRVKIIVQFQADNV